ncbi:LacI family DNA-binding transcriptional regulator [Vibrio furnissii]|uniref:LacI family DNA-binding transcriptional regulator n=1 Tax=Vibrio furnissii TaxID=29494 RepID=UPI003AA82279
MNIKEFADYLGLSTSTVSKALNNRSDIGEKTRKRVAEAAVALGYKPNVSARNLRSGKVNTVAMLLPVLSGDNILTASFFMRIAKGLHEVLHCHDVVPVIHITTDREEELALLQKIIDQKRADAIILADTEIHDERVEYLQERGFPFVTMGQSLSLNGQFNWVDFNYSVMGSESVEYALQQGAKNIAIVTLGSNSMHGELFLAGYKKRMMDKGMHVQDEFIFYGDKTEFSGSDAIEKFSQLEHQPDFIIFINDFQYSGACNYLNANVPSFIGKENMLCAIVSSDFFSSSLSAKHSFDIDHHAVGKHLAELAIAASEGKAAQQIVLDVHLRT